MKRIGVVTSPGPDDQYKCEQLLKAADIPIGRIKQEQPDYLSIEVDDQFAQAAVDALRGANFTVAEMPLTLTLKVVGREPVHYETKVLDFLTVHNVAIKKIDTTLHLKPGDAITRQQKRNPPGTDFAHMAVSVASLIVRELNGVNCESITVQFHRA